jgi:S-adenosylmethionine hydrolase
VTGAGATRRFETISFLSDYGLADEFVGVVKGVIRSIAPHVTVLDVTHDIPAHDVRAGSLALVRAIQYLPDGVILAVVDPGVGSDRRAVAVEAGEENPSVFIGPDNGLLAPAVALAGGARRAVSLTNADYHLDAPGPTFAGRDVFAPAAAHLALGVDLADLGEAVDPYSLLPGIVPLTRVEDGKVLGEVLWVDRFGNAQLNVGPDEVADLGDRVRVKVGDKPARLGHRVTTYADLKPGQVGLIVDSYGLLSVALDRRSAAEELRIGVGDGVLDAPAD